MFAFREQEKHNNSVKTCDWKHLEKLAMDEIEATLTALPKPLREQAQKLPVTFERVPNAVCKRMELSRIRLGCSPVRSLRTRDMSVLPPQIILFLENLWDFAEGDEEIFCEEVRTTFLHELGHYLGLDEDELTERGLE